MPAIVRRVSNVHNSRVTLRIMDITAYWIISIFISAVAYMAYTLYVSTVYESTKREGKKKAISAI